MVAQGASLAPQKILPPHGLPFLLVASAFAAYAFVPSGLSAHLLAIFDRTGIDAGTVVWIGALFGPAQVGARLIEFAFGRNLHPLWVARFALGALLSAFVARFAASLTTRGAPERDPPYSLTASCAIARRTTIRVHAPT